MSVSLPIVVNGKITILLLQEQIVKTKIVLENYSQVLKFVG